MHNMFLQVVDFQDHIVLDSNEGIYQKFTLLNGFYFSIHIRIMTVDCYSFIFVYKGQIVLIYILFVDYLHS